MRLYQERWGVWYVEIERGRVRSLRTKNSAKAKRICARIQKEALAGKLAHLTGECTKTLGDYIEEFLEWSEANQPRSTYRANRLALDKLKAVAGETIRLSAVSLKHLDRMVTGCRKPTKRNPKGLAVASINNYIRHARASLNKAVEWDYIKSNPLSAAKEYRTEHRQPGFMTRQEIIQFLMGIKDPEVRLLALAYLATGRRRGELHALEWGDIDLKAGRYLIRKSKAHLSRWYPINSTFHTALEAMGPGEGRVFKRWAHPDTLSKVMKKALRGAGLGHLTLHSLRHTFASAAVMQGRTLKDVQELLGQTEARTVEIYAHLADDHMAKAAEIYLGPVDVGLGRREK